MSPSSSSSSTAANSHRQSSCQAEDSGIAETIRHRFIQWHPYSR
jgi:hypothetical protein